MPELAGGLLRGHARPPDLVPLDLRMSTDAVEGDRPRRREARHLILGTGRDAPDPREAGLDHFPTTTRRRPVRRARRRRPALPARLGGPARPPGSRPTPDDIFQLVFTSGTTGTPKGVMLAHDNVLASIESFHADHPAPMEHRIVSLLPLSHLLEQAVGLFYALERRGGHPVRPQPQPAGHLRCAARPPGHLDGRRPAGPRPVLERRSSARSRSAARPPPSIACAAIARHLPMARPADGCSAASTSSSAAISACSCRPARSCRRRSSRAGRTWASSSSRATARPRPARAAARPSTTTASGRSGGRRPASRCGIADDGEVQFRGPTAVQRLLAEPEATAAAFTEDGWYKTGDIGHLDADGRLILSGRMKDIIVLPNGFNVYPEDIENALRIAGIRDSVVLETKPGRIEAIVLAGADRRAPTGRSGRDPRDRDRCRRQGRQRDARPEPADRRLAALARGGLPADPHAQGQARPGPRLGGADARGRVPTVGLRRPARRPPTRLGRDRVPHAERLERRLDRRRARSWRRAREPGVEDDRRADLADDVDRALRRLDAARAGREVAPAARRRPWRPAPGRGTRRPRCSRRRVRRQHDLVDGPRRRRPACATRPAGTATWRVGQDEVLVAEACDDLRRASGRRPAITVRSGPTRADRIRDRAPSLGGTAGHGHGERDEQRRSDERPGTPRASSGRPVERRARPSGGRGGGGPSARPSRPTLETSR